VIRTRALAAGALTVLLVASACSGDDSSGDGGSAGTKAVLTAVADDVIIPGYDHLSQELGTLAVAIGELCTSSDQATLDGVRQAWHTAQVAWGGTRAAMVGPAADRRLMSNVGAKARASSIESLVGGDEPVDAAALADAGTTVRGIFAVEVALFAPGSSALLHDPIVASLPGARRCEYARSVTQLAKQAVDQVLDDWTGDTDERSSFIEGGQDSVTDLVNDVNFRLQEIDDQGLHDLVGVTDPAALPDNRADGPAAARLEYLQAMYTEAAALLTGTKAGSIVDLVETRSPETADRLTTLVDAATEAMAALPPSVSAALADQPALTKAADAVNELRVLVGTELASQLGVTIGFSDSDGDS
jgi:predicted lipoprotein